MKAYFNKQQKKRRDKLSVENFITEKATFFLLEKMKHREIRTIKIIEHAQSLYSNTRGLL